MSVLSIAYAQIPPVAIYPPHRVAGAVPTGIAGLPGNDGETGPMPEHQTQNGTQVRFQKPDGSWGDWIETNAGNASLTTIRAMAVLGL